MSRVVVVGGGVAGLAAALRLKQAGIDVTVLERAGRAGGVIQSSPADGFLREHAANGFLGRGEDGAVDLCGELGVETCEASAAAKKRWIYVGDQLCPLPTNPIAFARSGLLSWKGKLAALGEPLRPAGRAGLDETVGSFARRRFGPEVADNIVGPFVTGIFAGDANQLSLRAAFPTLAELDANGGMIRGMIKRQLAARKAGGEPKKRKGGTGLVSPRHGVESLIAALLERLGDTVRTGAEVRSIDRAGGRTRLTLADGSTVDAEVVVLATQAYSSADLLEGASRELADTLRAIPYAPAVVLHLGFDRSSIEHPLDGFGFLVAAGERLRILGSVFESVLWPGRAPEGKVLLRCIFGGTRDPGAARASDDELVSAARADLDHTLGLRGDPVHVNLTRWPRAIAQYTVGHTERVDRAETLAAPLGVVLAGSGYHGVAVNSCVSDARRVVRAVTARLGGAIAALALAAFALGCSGSGSGKVERAPGRDGGDAAVAATTEPPAPVTPEGAAPPYLLADGGKPADGGRLEVKVAWADPPPAVLTSPGVNACGATRAPAVSVHTLHGLRASVVRIDGVARGIAPPPAEPAELRVHACAVEPRVQVARRIGAPIAVTTDDDRRHDLVLEREAAAGAEKVATLPLALIGQRYETALDRPGVYRIGGGDVADAGWVVVPPHPYVAAVDDQGNVAFDDVPAGTYQVEAWHPPLAAGEPPLVASGEITIAAGKTASLTLEPRPR